MIASSQPCRFQTKAGAVTIISQVYAPTAETSELDVIDEFCTEMQNEIDRMPKKYTLILMGDFNAKIGMGDEITKSVTGIGNIEKKR